MTFLRIVISLYLFCAHDLFGKPVATFPDHALARHSGGARKREPGISYLQVLDSGSPRRCLARNDAHHRIKKSGTEADRPTVPGGRGGPGARSGGGWRGAFPKPKNSRNAGLPDWTGRSFFAGFGGPPGAATVPSGEVDATGVSPLACSRPTSRRGQTKSSARPAGGASGSPLTSVRAASASTAAGREPGPPSNWSVPTEDATSGRIGPASGRGAGWPGTALASGVAGSVGSASGVERDASRRVISRST